jgi:2-phospho-L-lactate guanylyltransferase
MAEVVIAARGGTQAKQRCAAALDPGARALLTSAMLADMLEAVGRTHGVTRAWVVTPTADLAALAARMGAAIIFESKAQGLNAAFDRARSAVFRVRPNALLALLPGDLPLLDPNELSASIADFQAGEAILAPAKADGGTGAIVLAASSPMSFAWGPESFGRHIEASRAAGLRPRILASASMAFDLDRPEDFQTLLGCAGGARTRDLLFRGEAAA